MKTHLFLLIGFSFALLCCNKNDITKEGPDYSQLRVYDEEYFYAVINNDSISVKGTNNQIISTWMIVDVDYYNIDDSVILNFGFHIIDNVKIHFRYLWNSF